VPGVTSASISWESLSISKAPVISSASPARNSASVAGMGVPSVPGRLCSTRSFPALSTVIA
jgi:hypothetical protein